MAFLKIDVQFAEEDEQFTYEFGIPTRKVYSGELCPDHCNVMVMGDALHWARRAGSDVLLVQTAGLCLRCSPYVDGGLDKPGALPDQDRYALFFPTAPVHVAMATQRSGQFYESYERGLTGAG